MGFVDQTFTVGQFITAQIMNWLQDSLDYLLKEQPLASAYITAAGTYTTTSATPVLVNSSMSHTRTFTGTRAEWNFSAGVAAVTGFASAWIYVNGVQGARLFNQVQTGALIVASGFIEGLTPGSNTIEVRWSTTAGTATMYQQGANGGTTQGNAAIFNLKEV